MTPASFKIESAADGICRVSGTISFANAGAALKSAPATGARAIDIAGLHSPDSATLAVLIAWSARAAQKGATVRYVNTPEDLRNLAQLSQVGPLIGLN